MSAQIEMQKDNKSRAVANFVTQKKSNAKQVVGFLDNRPEAAAQRKILETLRNSYIDKSPENIWKTEKRNTIQRVHIGVEPTNPDNFRTVTRVTGSTTAHYGGGPMNIHAGVYNSNIANGPGVIPVALPGLGGGGISDHSNQQLLDRGNASNYVPEIDHIVPSAALGSNSYSNARVISQSENNSPAVNANRPNVGQISTIAHHRINIQNPMTGYNNNVNARGALAAPDMAEVGTFGGLQAAINAASGTTNNNVTITEF